MYRPELYARGNMAQRTDATFILEHFVSKLRWKASEVVLDIGCGSGEVTKDILLPVLPKENSRIIAVDKMSSMIDYAKEHNCNDQIDYKVMDIMELVNHKDISDQKFSKIFSFYCLNWITDYDLCLRNIFNVLNNDGQALLVFQTSFHMYDMYDTMLRRNKWNKYLHDVENTTGKYNFFIGDPAEDFRKKAKKTGFQIEYCEIREVFYDCDLTEARNLFDSLNPFSVKIPVDQRSHFLDECFQELLKYFPINATGGMSFNHKRLEVILSK